MSWVMDYMRQLNEMIWAQRMALNTYNNARMLRNNQIVTMNNSIKVINASYGSSSNTGSTGSSSPSVTSVILTDDNDNYKNTTEYRSVNGGAGNDTISNTAKYANTFRFWAAPATIPSLLLHTALRF